MNNKTKLKFTIGTTIPVAVVVMLVLRFGNLESDVKANKEAIDEVKETPLKVATIETEVKHINKKLVKQEEDIDEIMREQKVMTKEMSALATKLEVGFGAVLKELKK